MIRNLITMFNLMIIIHESTETYKPRAVRSPLHYTLPPARPPVCHQVPHEVCHQVPKTVYEAVVRHKCVDISQEVCADVKEHKCKILQLPVQGEVLRRDCSIDYKKDCKLLHDVKKECFNINNYCFDYSELKCVDVPKTVEETVHEESCEVITTDDCVTNIKNKCNLKTETICTNNTVTECDVKIKNECTKEENQVCDGEPAKNECHKVTEKECKKIPFTECKVS